MSHSFTLQVRYRSAKTVYSDRSSAYDLRQRSRRNENATANRKKEIEIMEPPVKARMSLVGIDDHLLQTAMRWTEEGDELDFELFPDGHIEVTDAASHGDHDGWPEDPGEDCPECRLDADDHYSDAALESYLEESLEDTNL